MLAFAYADGLWLALAYADGLADKGQLKYLAIGAITGWA